MTLYQNALCKTLFVHVLLYSIDFSTHIQTTPKRDKSFDGLLSVVVDPFMNTKFKFVDLIS